MTTVQDSAEQLLAHLQATNSPTINTPILVSGTAQQDPTGQVSTYYVNIGLHASGTVTYAIGPTNACANVLATNDDASTAKSLAIRVPPSWFIKVTVGGSATIAGCTQITG